MTDQDVPAPDPQYLEKLQRKLDRLKKPAAKLRASDIILGLSDLNEHQLGNLTEQSTQLHEGDDQPLQHNPLVRKLFPEKIALTSEELESLLTQDALSAQVAEHLGLSTDDLRKLISSPPDNKDNSTEPDSDQNPWSTDGRPDNETQPDPVVSEADMKFDDNFIDNQQ